MEIFDFKGQKLKLGEVIFGQSNFLLSVVILGRNNYPSHVSVFQYISSCPAKGRAIYHRVTDPQNQEHWGPDLEINALTLPSQ